MRPTIMSPVWHVGAYVMGAATALMGEKAAMACTVAVEEVIAKHYQEQIDALDDSEKDLREKIIHFRNEEIEHKDIGFSNKATDASGYLALRFVVGSLTKTAIKISKVI